MQYAIFIIENGVIRKPNPMDLFRMSFAPVFTSPEEAESYINAQSMNYNYEFEGKEFVILPYVESKKTSFRR